MKVFAIKAYGNYGGGMSVVAANDEDEAKKIAEAAERSCWNVRYGKPESIEILPVSVAGEPRVLVHYETGE